MKNKFDISLKYKVKMNSDLYSVSIDSLTYNYLPIIGKEAFILYLFFLREVQNKFLSSNFVDSVRIIEILKLNEKEINKSIFILEKLNLLEFYKNKAKEKEIIFLLKKPKSTFDFNDDDYLKNILISEIGEENFEINNRYFNKNYLKKERNKFDLLTNKKNLSKDHDSKEINKTLEIDFYPIFHLLEKISINYHNFWDSELEETIKKLIFINNLRTNDIVNSMIELKNKGKDINKKNIIDFFNNKNNFKIFSSDKIDKKQLMKVIDPLTFIKFRLDRKPLLIEKELILELKSNLNLKEDLINLLIEYSIFVNNGAINKNYIFKISETIIKENILNFDNLLEYLKHSNKIKNGTLKKNNDLFSNESVEAKELEKKVLEEEYLDEEFFNLK